MELKKNITSIFMVPTLRIPRDALNNNNFINGYVKDEGRDVQYENAVYLLFQPRNLNRFREFLEEEHLRTTSILDDYDYEGGYVVVVYQLDLLYKEDFELIKKGKYSKTSEAFQKLFPSVVKLIKNGLYRDELSLQFRIFNKTPDLVEFWENEFGMTFSSSQEIWQGFIDEDETLNVDKLKEYAEQ